MSVTVLLQGDGVSWQAPSTNIVQHCQTLLHVCPEEGL